MENGRHFVYIAECADGTYYTGYAACVESRVAVHNSGKGAKYTRGRLPVRAVYAEEFDTKGEALVRERAIKKLRRSAKERLAAAAGELRACDEVFEAADDGED